MTELLDTQACQQALTKLQGWQANENCKAISKTYKFKDFKQAFAFMERVAIEADALDHHPDWSNSYNKVEITLSTHDAGGVTDNDIMLATKIEDAYAA